jgi:hypothetical protein
VFWRILMREATVPGTSYASTRLHITPRKTQIFQVTLLCCLVILSRAANCYH